jgi:hypothetical protein
MIFYSHEYHNESGISIIQNHIVSGLPPEGFPIFQGVAYIDFQTPRGPIHEKIVVPINAKTIEEAFDKYQNTMEKEGPEEAKRVVDRIRSQLQEKANKIIIPNSQG